ncbi:putative FAD-binding oxidoreductase [Aaosphaeria arxii CBS 175.79]|uniref:Putative FAD-binding oxidoreductase n=1 Tax=Aaosphaeria arxii CBS 175.79 TaxID=1450172 RepID=A0A6A5XGQ1_9PLEO|nr:putative FAD-binding oxidoreductase [Aaosphaeria arxii CBS 175.79]KAF2012415.1 putative FAD-binding oxidoreductase [Aaosphaeria arxii CBS 175.79]
MRIWLLFSSCGLLVATTRTSNVPATSLCEAWKGSDPANVSVPNEEEYEILKNSNWSPVARRQPACIIRVQNTETLKELLPQLVEAQVQFAIRSGGHMVVPEASNINDGVLIDLSRVDAIKYSPRDQTVLVGSGARWKHLYEVLEMYNRTAVGGRMADIGIGGLLLGGGLSWLSNKYGLACDNVVNYEVILANGTIINANASSSSDLFRALKGGGNNFGIVLHFTLRTYPLQRVWGGTKFYAHEQFPALVAALARYQAAPIQDPDANVMIQGPITNSSYGIILTLVYSQPIENPPAFSAFEGIPVLLDNTAIRTYADLIASANESDISQLLKWDFRTATFALNATLYNELLHITTDSPEVATISKLNSGTFVFNLQPISTGVVKEGKLRGGNSLGLSEEPQVWVEYLTAWSDVKADDLAYSSARSILNRVEQVAHRSGNYHQYKFMNDASWDQDVIGHYGDNNVAFLKSVQVKYDPGRTFQSLVRGGFKIPT